MSTKFKDVNIKYYTHYFFDDIINIKNFEYSYLLHWICDDQRL